MNGFADSYEDAISCIFPIPDNEYLKTYRERVHLERRMPSE